MWAIHVPTDFCLSSQVILVGGGFDCAKQSARKVDKIRRVRVYVVVRTACPSQGPK